MTTLDFILRVAREFLRSLMKDLVNRGQLRQLRQILVEQIF
jgi:hypothetical protein